MCFKCLTNLKITDFQPTQIYSMVWEPQVQAHSNYTPIMINDHLLLEIAMST